MIGKETEHKVSNNREVPQPPDDNAIIWRYLTNANPRQSCNDKDDHA